MADIGEVIRQTALVALEAARPLDIFRGRVETAKPLSILLEQGMILPEHCILLSQQVTNYTTKISFDNPLIKQVYTTWDMSETKESAPEKICFKTRVKHEITVYNALCVGEHVFLLRLTGGQKYLVLDRVGGGE